MKWKITMNDEYLNQFYEVPRPEYADALYERISQQPEPRFAQSIMKKLTLRNAGLTFAILFFVAACVYAVIERGWRKVGGIWINVQQTYTVEYFPAPEVSEGSTVQSQDYECLTVEEVREILQFKLKVPTWAPEGFVLNDKMCGVDRISDLVYLYWAGPDEYSGIEMIVNNLKWYDVAAQEYEIGDPAIWSPVAPDSYQEVQVHGQSAILIRGDWGSHWSVDNGAAGKKELQWAWQALQLYWVDGEVMYHLYSQAFLPVEDLIRMAESTR